MDSTNEVKRMVSTNWEMELYKLSPERDPALQYKRNEFEEQCPLLPILPRESGKNYPVAPKVQHTTNHYENKSANEEYARVRICETQ
jgi:hypothetical protein